jgi:hypothetical protein
MVPDKSKKDQRVSFKLSDLLKNKKGRISVLFNKNKSIGLCDQDILVSEIAKLKCLKKMP